MAILPTAEHALHADPLGYDNLLGVNPLVIGIIVRMENVIDLFLLLCTQSHAFLSLLSLIDFTAGYC